MKNNVEIFLKEYVGSCYEIMESSDVVYIGSDFPDEFTGSKDTAKLGWYRYYSRFALPVYSEDGSLERYNVFHVQMIIRHDKNGKKYLYDLINIKKESSTPHCL